jgi:hypothetical protein
MRYRQLDHVVVDPWTASITRQRAKRTPYIRQATIGARTSTLQFETLGSKLLARSS